MSPSHVCLALHLLTLDSLPWALATFAHPQLSHVDPADSALRQSKSGPPAPSNLYRIFTNEDSRPTADKDAAKNVRLVAEVIVV